MTRKSVKRKKASGGGQQPSHSDQFRTHSTDSQAGSPTHPHESEDASPKKRRKNLLRSDKTVSPAIEDPRHLNEARPATEDHGNALQASDTQLAGYAADNQTGEPELFQCPTSSFELVRLLRDPKVLRSRKIEVAYQFVKRQGGNLDVDRSPQPGLNSTQLIKTHIMTIPLFVSTLFEWVQSAILWSSKPQNSLDGKEASINLLPSHLDARYWAILRWCLLRGGRRQGFLTVSPSLMKSLNIYVSVLLESNVDSDAKVVGKFVPKSLTDDSVSSVETLLQANERSFKPDPDHWISLASTALTKLIALRNAAFEPCMRKTNSAALRLIASICEGFARFVDLYPNRKKIFVILVNRMLEILLVAHADLCRLSGPDNEANVETHAWKEGILQSIDDILHKGVFHASHVGGFHEVCKVLAREAEDDSKGDDQHLSYHSLLFQRLNLIREETREKAAVAMQELGWMFQIYCKGLKSYQTADDVRLVSSHSRAKPRPLVVGRNDGAEAGEQGKESRHQSQISQLAEKRKRRSELEFTVFAELVWPLIMDLADFETKVEAGQLHDDGPLLSSARVALQAAANLVGAAHVENAYIATEDGAAQLHLDFLRKCFTTLLAVGKSLMQLLFSPLTTESDEDRNGEAKCVQIGVANRKRRVLLSELFCELIAAMTHLLTMEYRVVEESLQDIWKIVVAELFLLPSCYEETSATARRVKRVSETVVELACQMIKTFSDLRQVDRAIFSLCTTLRALMFESLESHLSGQSTSLSSKGHHAGKCAPPGLVNLKGMGLLLSSNSFLLAVSSAVRALPEGQVPEFLRLLKADALESSKVVKDVDFTQHTLPSTKSSSKDLLKLECLEGFTDLYSWLLENIVVTSSNSVAVGKGVRLFLNDVIVPKLNEVIGTFAASPISDASLSDKCESNGLVSGPEDDHVDDSAETADGDAKSLNRTWAVVFLLRLYLITKSLFSESVTLMPPKAAKKVRASMPGQYVDYHSVDKMEILTGIREGRFFSGVGQGKVKVSRVLGRMLKSCRGGRGLVSCPVLRYTLDCVALRSLTELAEQTEALSYLTARFENVTHDVLNGEPCGERMEGNEFGKSLASKDTNHGVQTKLLKAVNGLKKENKKLASILLDRVRPCESVSDPVSENFASDCSEEATASKSHETLEVQKWNLLCKSFDIWSKYAAEADLRKVLVFLLSTSLMEPPTQRPDEGAVQHMSLKEITDATLGNVLFYEEKSFRRLFSSTIVEELQKTSRLAFKEWPFAWCASESGEVEEFPKAIEDEWLPFTEKLKEMRLTGSDCSLGGEVEIQPETAHSARLFRRGSSAPEVGASELPSQLFATSTYARQKGCRWTPLEMRALDISIGLVNRLSALPPGYIEAKDLPTCAYTILCIERLLMQSFLELRATTYCRFKQSSFDHIDPEDILPIIYKLLEALGACRAGLLAMTYADGLPSRASSLMILLTGNSLSIEWFSLTMTATAAYLSELLDCTNLPVKQKRDFMTPWKLLLDQAVKSTAALMTSISEKTLTETAWKGTHRATAIDPVSNGSAQGIAGSPLALRLEGPAGVLTQVIAEGVKLLDTFILARGVNGNWGDENSDHEDQDVFDSYDLDEFFKHYYGELALSASLSSYFWALSKVFEDSVKEQRDLPNASLSSSSLVDLAVGKAQTLGCLLTRTLLRSVIDDSSSHAMSLFGEVDIEKELVSSGDEKNPISYGSDFRPMKAMAAVGTNDDDEEVEEEEDRNTIWPHLANDFDEQSDLGEEEDNDTEEEDEFRMEEDGTRTARGTDVVPKVKAEGTGDSNTSDPNFSFTDLSDPQRNYLSQLVTTTRHNGSVIGEVFLAAAGLVKLECTRLSNQNSATGATCPSSCHSGHDLPFRVHILVGASYWLLREAAKSTPPHRWVHQKWLLGPLKYLAAGYSLFTLVKPPLPPSAFSTLFAMLVDLLGALISAEQSLDQGLTAFDLLDSGYQQPIGLGDGVGDGGEPIFKRSATFSAAQVLKSAVHDALKASLRNASRHHSVLALQYIIRTLVGASDASGHRSGLQILGSGSGKVGSQVAAAVECLSLSLVAVSGAKRLKLLANHFNEFFGALFSLLDYLHGSHLFQQPENQKSSAKTSEPEFSSTCKQGMVHAGPVALQALQILITAASRDAIFPMKSSHVALALHCPAMLFQHFCKSEYLKCRLITRLPRREQQQHSKKQVKRETGLGTELGVKLYVSCCRLLCSVVRHRRRESGHCISLLGDSARVLLKCLETPNWTSQDEDVTGSRNVQVAAYCARWLRRIYEEIGEHKESLGKYSSHLLSDYLSVFSGHGPNASGFSREVEAALRPGIFALIDSCSVPDLQQLHAVLGEGPRRTALVNLKRQYQEQFKYTGKV